MRGICLAIRRRMNHSERRSNLRPRIIALLLALCVLVAAVAAAPGWINRPTHTAADTEPTTGPATVSVEAAAPAFPISIAANEIGLDAATLIDTPSDPLATTFEFDTAAMASAVAQRAVDDALFDEWRQMASAESVIGADYGAPVRLAVLSYRTIGAPGGGTSRSGNSPSAGTGSAPGAIAPGGGDSGKHSDHSGDDSTPVESLPAAPSAEPSDVISLDPWPAGQPPIDASGTQPVSVPEPGTLGLLALGLAGVAGARRRRAARRD